MRDWHICRCLQCSKPGEQDCCRFEKERDALLEQNKALKNRLDGVTQFCPQCESYAKERDRYKETLISISKNSCCKPCREAGLVAQSALAPETT